MALLVACASEPEDNADTDGGGTGASAGTPSSSAGGAVPSNGGLAAGGGSAGQPVDAGGTGMNAAGLGGGGTGGAGAAGTAAGASPEGGGAGQPTSGAPIDFARWSLQLPTGSGTSPTTISPKELLAGFSNDYFYVAADGGQAFMSPQAGITTPGSSHCRTEMREQRPTGGAAAWKSSGTHRLTVEGKVTKIGGGSIAIGQLFNDTDSIPLIELQYTTSSKLVLLYEEAKGAPTIIDLKTSVSMSARYTYVFEMTDGELSVSIDGKQVYTRRPSAGILDNDFYFKVGNYDQSAEKGSPSKTPYSIVEAYSVQIVHE